MKSNKEIINELSAYFEKQDHKTICRTLANCMIDYNRIQHAMELPKDEYERLHFRIQKNSEMVHKFAKEGCSEDLKLINLEPKDDN